MKRPILTIITCFVMLLFASTVIMRDHEMRNATVLLEDGRTIQNAQSACMGRTLSASDSGPTPRKAKSDFLSVVLKLLASVLGAYSSCSITFITFRRVFSDTGPFRLITRDTIHLMFYEKV